jgi:preprotein translocase subunit SecB
LWHSTAGANWWRCWPARPLGDNFRLGARHFGSVLFDNETLMADDNQTPVFQIQRIYLKDLSLEQPNSPQILLEQQQPQVEINLGLAAEPISEGVYEVCVTGTVTTKVADKTLFLIEAKQAGIFELRNIPQDQLQAIIGIACPQIIYPYLRAIVSDVCTRAGFPPVLLAEVNFQAMYEAQQQQAGAGTNGNGSGSRIITSA